MKRMFGGDDTLERQGNMLPSSFGLCLLFLPFMFVSDQR